MKKLIFLGAYLIALSSQPLMAQTGGVEVVIVRIAESSSNAHVTIERAGQEPEEIEFDWDSRIGKKWPRASKGYLEALSKLYQQGYQVQATIPGAITINGGTNFTTLIFTRAANK
jgi:hypothetical protein